MAGQSGVWRNGKKNMENEAGGGGVPVEQFLVLKFGSHRNSTVRIYGAGIGSDRGSSIGTVGATFVTAAAAATAARGSSSSFSRGISGATAGD